MNKSQNTLDIESTEQQSANTTQVYINDIQLDALRNQVGNNYKNKYDSTIINSIFKPVTKDSLEKFTNWLVSSQEKLKSNKNVIKYNMNSATNAEAKATGEVSSMNVDSVNTNGEFITGYTNITRLHSNDNNATLDSNIGFKVTKKKIDELLIERLTDSLGKQSPINGKVFDDRSIINANVLPVIKNGSITHTHRILETLLQAEAVYAKQCTGNQNDEGFNMFLEIFSVKDLADDYSRDILEHPRIGNTTYNSLLDINVVSKAITVDDFKKDLVRFAAGAMYLQPNLTTSSSSSYKGVGLNVYSGCCTSDLKPLLSDQLAYVHGRYLDLSPRASTYGNSVWTIVPMTIFSQAGNDNNTSNKTIFYYCKGRDNSHASSLNFHKVTVTSTDTDAAITVFNDFNQMLKQGKYQQVQDIISAGTYTKGEGDDAVTYTFSDVRPSNVWCTKHIDAYKWRSTHPAFENIQDIANAFDLLAKLHVTWKIYDSYNSKTDVTLYRNKSTQTFLLQSSIWARIAMYYGHLVYTDNIEKPIGDQSLISNKVYNYAYARVGLLAKAAENTFGSFQAVNAYMDLFDKQILLDNFEVMFYNYEANPIIIPLFSRIGITDYNALFTIGRNSTIAGAYYIAQYFTDARWWRYDYFGGQKFEAPSQRLTMNSTDQDYDENVEKLFVNTDTVYRNNGTFGTTIGSLTCRFTPNGIYSPLNIVSLSYCPNTTIRFTIPKIFKDKQFSKAVLLHGLDLIQNVAPVWYAPYDAKYTLVDDGSFSTKLRNRVF